MIGARVIRLFTIGVCSIMKILAAPESAMASFVRRVTLVAARACVFALWVDVLDEMLDVITIASSSLSMVAGVEHWVGYDVLLAELT